MDVAPQELRTVTLREAWRGYRHDDVDGLLERVAGTIERLQAQVDRLSERLAKAENEAGLGREADEMLRRTLLLAQRTADAAVAEAQERARRVVSESEAHAHSIVSGAEEEARRIAIAERRRVENEIHELLNRRDVLVADIEALEQGARDHRRRLRELLEAELSRLDTRPLPEAPDIAVSGDSADAEIDLAAADEAGTEFGEGGDGSTTDTQVDSQIDSGVDSQIDSQIDTAMAPEGDTPDILPSKRRRWRVRESELDTVPPDDRFFDELRQAIDDDTPLGPRDPVDDPVGEATGDSGEHSTESTENSESAGASTGGGLGQGGGAAESG